MVFAARRSEVPIWKPLPGADLPVAAAWVSARRDWPPPEVLGAFMRERALKIIAAFPCAKVQTTSRLDPN